MLIPAILCALLFIQWIVFRAEIRYATDKYERVMAIARRYPDSEVTKLIVEATNKGGKITLPS